jgi:lysophospholipase L1-like esterase
MSDLIYFMDDIVFPYQPNAIVVYEGDNDIAAGKTPEIILRDYNTFVSNVLEKWPNKPIFFISIKPSLARIDHLENMATANALIKARTEEVENLYYIDVFTPMLGEDGTPRPDIFGHDGLHMNEVGYALWTKVVKEELGL